MGLIIDLMKKNSMFNALINFQKKIIFNKENKRIEAEALKRKNGYEDSKYLKLKKFYNKYSGESCFIVSMGPSLTAEDLNKIRYEFTFGMNSICLKFEELNWYPTFYGIQDKYVYEKIKNDVNKIDKIPVFVGSTIKSKEVHDNWIYFPLNSAYHDYEARIGRYFSKVSDDCYSVVYDGYSITYSLIQLAIYMGFKEIYLIGNDCNYLGDKHHFVEYGYVDKNHKVVGNRMLAAYYDLAKYIENTDVKIYNATRGGMLEAFPRVDIDKMKLKTNELGE
ncbi:MAG: DUF115 domain-containing protein [Bacteroidales bacterium]|nr:DUF115 domain-containing protein [Clostridium sp.]MCM1203289.1 DUF115 domain-containing protein [Bacteroidales bacterium]